MAPEEAPDSRKNENLVFRWLAVRNDPAGCYRGSSGKLDPVP